MRTKMLILAMAAGLLSSPVAARQDDATPPMSAESLEETRPRTDAMFQTLRAGDPAKAYRDLFAGTVMETKDSELGTLITQTQTLLDAYGTLTNWNVMRSDCLTPSLCRVGYQVDLKNGPFFIFVLFHRRAGGWFPHWVFVTDIAAPLFELR